MLESTRFLHPLLTCRSLFSSKSDKRGSIKVLYMAAGRFCNIFAGTSQGVVCFTVLGLSHISRSAL